MRVVYLRYANYLVTVLVLRNNHMYSYVYQPWLRFYMQPEL